MVTKIYDWCLVYWQGAGWYVVNANTPWQVVVVGGFVPGWRSENEVAVYCRTADAAAELAAS